jgi:hypothetical protein
MDVIWRLQCNGAFGSRIDRETATGLVTVITVARQSEALAVHVMEGPVITDLEVLDGLRARDCNDLERRIDRPDVTITMPDV